MKAQRFTKIISARKSGFALVVTLTLMVLLSILALGMLSLSSIELRKSAVSKHQSIARQNALLALQLAIGELQEHLGPDKRTSANADLLANNSPNPHWVGAWNTEGGFRNWLVSGNETTTQANDPKDAAAPAHLPGAKLTSANSGDPGVVLVGENSSGSDLTNHVTAPLVNLKSQVSGDTEGRYAWWVGDEGVKASLGIPVRPVPTSGVAERLAFSSSFPNRGFPTLGGDWKKWLPDGGGALLESTAGKLVTRRQVPLADKNLVDEEKEHFHDFTVASAGVLSDSKYGGLRKDLSIAFELPDDLFKKTEFTRKLAAGDIPESFTTDHGGTVKSGSPFKGRQTKPIVNFSDPQFGGGFYRGATFDQLRDHYQLYRRLSKPLTADAAITAQLASPNVADMGKAPWQEWSDRTDQDTGVGQGEATISDTSYNNSPSIRPLTTELAPVLIHYAYTMSLQSYPDGANGKSRIRLIVNPFIALHNPYNVVLNSPPVHLRIARAEVAIEIRYPSNSGGVFSLTDPFVDSNEPLSADAGYQRVDHYLSDSGDPHPTGDGNGITLQPGEVKLYTITGGKPVNADVLFSSASRALLFEAVDPATNLGQVFSSGLYTQLRWTNGDPYLIDNGKDFYVKVNNTAYINATGPQYPTLGNDWNEYFYIQSKLVKPFSGNPNFSTPDGWPEIGEVRIFSNPYWQGSPVNNSELTLTPEQIAGDISAAGGGQRTYVAQTNYYVKPAFEDNSIADNNFSLATHNPRAPAQSTTASGGQGPNATRGPGTWAGNAERLDGGNPNFTPRFWGTGKNFGGSIDGGLDHVTLFDVPRSPLTSLASFQHANISRLYAEPAFPIANSYASPFVPINGLVRKSNSRSHFNVDISYIYNEALFDSYFFSGVNPGSDGSLWKNKLSSSSVILGSADPTALAPLQDKIDRWITGEETLANSRILFNPASGGGGAADSLDLAARYTSAQTSLASTKDIRPHNAIAAYALNYGAFNVNSTSVDAWRVILASMRGAAIDHFDVPTGLAVDSDQETAAFAGNTLPGADSTLGDDRNLWNGFRRLSDTEIDTLAKNLVKGIKARTKANNRPFTTMGEFVNRSLETSDFGNAGVLQAAIDESGLNNPEDLSNEPVPEASSKHTTNRETPDEIVTSEFANPNAMASSTIAGTPQWLTQADVLETIGSQLSARSDTFVIRAYGESLNPKSGVVQSRAWLEATVQRGTGFTDPTDHPALPIASISSEVNRYFGRVYKVIAFRWLSRSEI